MFLHIEFANHSNPYVYFGPHPAQTTKEDCMKVLKKWEQCFEALTIKEEHGGIFVKMRERNSTNTQEKESAERLI